MKKLKEKGTKNSKTVLGFIIGMIVSSVTAYLTTTYALTENNYPIYSRNVEYTDSFNLGANDVQAAIKGTCSNIDTRLTDIESSDNLVTYNTPFTKLPSGYTATFIYLAKS